MKEVLEKEEIDRLAAWLIQAPHRATIGDLDKSGRVLRFLYEKVMKQASHMESLEKDAARYRVVRDPFSKGDFSNLYLEELDSAIDAAMQS